MLGSRLVDVLSSEHEVKAIDIDNCDITNQKETTKTITDYSPSIIIHTAAYTDVDGSELNLEKAFAVNTGGTENVVSAAKKVGSTLFYISTDYVFDGEKDEPYEETDIPNPINIYGRSKLEGEKITQALLEKYLILRTSWLFGPNGKNFVITILQKAKEKETLKVVDDQIGSPTYTLDLAKAIKSLLSTLNSQLSTKFYGIYNITNSGSCSWYEFAKEIISLKQLKTQILPVSSAEIKRPAKRPKMSILDSSKLMNIFNLKLRSWKEALNHFLLTSA